MGNAQSLPTFLFRSSLGFAVFASVGKQHASRKLGCGITYCKLMVPTIMLPNAYFCWMMKHKPGSFTGGAKTDTAWPVLRGYSKMARTVSKQSLMLLTHLLRHRVAVFYCIDECWKFFNARDWQNTGPGVLFYSAQHRKLGDTLLLLTQHSKQVES